MAVQILSWFSSSILSISALERSLPSSDLASRNLVSAASARQLAESTAAEEEEGESTASYARKWIFFIKNKYVFYKWFRLLSILRPIP